MREKKPPTGFLRLLHMLNGLPLGRGRKFGSAKETKETGSEDNRR